ncbi:MAG: dihydropteroate synthase [Peptococcaceae bacterium]|jgi:dihydropteroate synthase|nr:dihydropteroate synthase [Peptococcaceae bacterium]MDH7523700.1 dihydropteroate synthase [Peptococcaceae bacterium]
MRGPYLLELEDREKTKRVFESVGPDRFGLEWMLDKAHIHPLYLKEVKSPAANVLKQQMLSLGGDAVVGKWVIDMSRDESDVLLLGTVKQYKALSGKLSGQPWGLKALGERIENLLNAITAEKKICWEWPRHRLEIGKKTLIMGILNVTPDSFSDGGRFIEPGKACERARKMVEEGADIIDVGGESTRPGSQPVSVEEELNRVMPVLETLVRELPVPISIDTYKAQTAREALRIGVHIINDVGGGKKDEGIAAVAAEYGAPVIIMHNESKPTEIPQELVAGVIDDLAASLEIYKRAGLAADKMMVDPGIGFGKGPVGNLILLRNLQSFRTLDRPVLLGASRKSFIGAVLGTPVSERLEGSLAAAAWGVFKGAAVLRVHDVQETCRLVRMLEGIKHAGES